MRLQAGRWGFKYTGLIFQDILVGIIVCSNKFGTQHFLKRICRFLPASGWVFSVVRIGSHAMLTGIVTLQKEPDSRKHLPGLSG